MGSWQCHQAGKFQGSYRSHSCCRAEGRGFLHLPESLIMCVHSEGAGYRGIIQTMSLPLRTKGFCIVFKESSFHRVKGSTPRTEGAEDWQRPALTHEAEMQGSTDKAQRMLWHPGTMWSLCCCRLPSRLHTQFLCQLPPWPLPASAPSPALPAIIPHTSPTLKLCLWTDLFFPLQSKLLHINLKRVNLPKKHSGTALHVPC